MILSYCPCEELGVNLAHGAEAPVDLLIDAALIATSVALLCYWFRYGCLLILAAETPHDYSEEVAKVNRLSFPEVRSKLRKRGATDLNRLHQCLERDFATIAYLLEHTPIASSDTGFEDAMLKIHFRAMSACFHLTRSKFRESASDALEEMCGVVAYLANRMGERRAAAH
jgi:hypothetical protein